MEAKMSVLGLIMSFSPYLRSAMVRFPLGISGQLWSLGNHQLCSLPVHCSGARQAKLNYIYGINKIQPIWADHYFKTISNAKMGLNLSRGEAIKYYSSDRITQIVGNGLVCLIDEKTQYRDFFTNNEMVFYKNVSDLSENINKISRDDKLRRKIAKNGKLKYMKFFNSNLVAQFIIDKTFEINSKNKYFWSSGK